MTTLPTLEMRRLEAQKQLDGMRNSDERNRLGQYATAPELALEIARYARRLWRNDSKPVRFFEPAFGTGAFYSALCSVFERESLVAARGIELDTSLIKAAANLWQDGKLELTQGDFTELLAPPTDKYNLLLTNPPYVRHHHLGKEQKARLQQAVWRNLGIRVSGLAGLYCYFLLLADAWLAEDALSVWLIPSEFMDVNYGQAVKRYLMEQVTLLHIHRFCPTDVQFADALVSSAIVVFRKRRPAGCHKILFTFGGSLETPQAAERITLSHLGVDRNWTQYPAATVSSASASSPKVTLADMFTIKRGIATGANAFFILPREEALRQGFPNECLRPILPSPRLLTTTSIQADADGYPLLPNPLSLLSCDYPEEEVQRRFPQVWAYLQQGTEQSVHKGYLTSRRSPWYIQEKRPAAPFLCTYMGRSREGRKPFRFFWNRSAATAPNVYLLLYPKGVLQAKLQAQPALYEVVFAALQNLDAGAFAVEGRVYGGGLYKMEPNELGRISAVTIHDLLGRPDVRQQGTLAFETAL